MSDFQSIPNVYELDVTNIRELIAYCDARFRAALKVITSPNNHKRESHCKFLAMELVCIYNTSTNVMLLTIFESNFAYPELVWLRLWVILSTFPS